MSPFAAQSFRTSALAIALALATAAINAAPAQAQTFNFIQKLQLNPLPFEDPGMNAYWKGVGKYSNSQDVWRVTITMNTQDKHPNVPVPGVITIDKWDFKAVNMRTGECHQVDLAGTVSLLDNSARLSGVTGGVIVNLSGIVRSWWTVKGARKGPNVIQGVLSFG